MRRAMRGICAALAFFATVELASTAASAAATNTSTPSMVSQATSSRPVRKGYAPAHGLRMYFEIHGTPRKPGQPPLVLLHGGGDTIETSFGHVLASLARGRQVIAFEQQGYGRTADMVDRPFSFEQSADDTASLLAHLGIDRADLLGFSNGGTIALQVAIRHPRVVRKIVAISALAARDGVNPGFWDMMNNARLENMPVELQEAYRNVAPQPENLRLFHDKAAQRMRDFKDIPADAIRSIDAPTLVMCGDTDVVRPEHAVELFRLIPSAQLAVIPGTDHMAIMQHAEWIVPMVEAFLDAPSPAPASSASSTN